MTRQINLYEAKTHLSSLVDDAASGDVIIIAKDGKPMAQLGPVAIPEKQPRQLGQLSEQAEGIDWVRWWRGWKAADKEIEANFEQSVAKRFPTTRPKRRRKPRHR
jgi:antitoxin (DNA-binding transcriptional repressor) of toxin-antitoxin stability system